MSNWRRWLNIVGWVSLAAFLAWHVANAAPSHSRRVLCFAVTFALVLTGAALSYLEMRRFLRIKICYVIVVVVWLKLLGGFSRGDLANPTFIAAVFLLLSFLQPLRPRPRFRFRDWWPAMKRTVRRLCGGWREDEERFL